MKILIVDDHPLFRAGFHAVLETSQLDAGVLSVSSIPEALQILQRDADVGLVLLDIHLRGDDGFSALKVIGAKIPDHRLHHDFGRRAGQCRGARHVGRCVGLHSEVLYGR